MAHRSETNLLGPQEDLTGAMPSYPRRLPEKYRKYWDKPYSLYARRNKGFRRWLDDNGYLTPNFTKREAACKDGTPVPDRLNRACRDHAFKLERLRHAVGDRPIPIISWYRHPAYNRRVGGASRSQHINAIATDIPREWVSRVGRRKVLAEANRIFYNGGLGTYPWGAIHVDSRGWRARWSSY